MADRQFAAVNAKLKEIYAADFAIFTVFSNKKDESDFDRYYQTWVKDRLSGFTNVFTTVDKYGFVNGRDARMLLVDLRTMEVLADERPMQLDQMIQRCKEL